MSFAGRHIVLALWGMLIACSSLRAGYQGVGYAVRVPIRPTPIGCMPIGNAAWTDCLRFIAVTLTLTLNGQLVRSEYGGVGDDILAAGSVCSRIGRGQLVHVSSENSDGTSVIQQAGLTELTAFEAVKASWSTTSPGGMFIVPAVLPTHWQAMI